MKWPCFATILIVIECSIATSNVIRILSDRNSHQNLFEKCDEWTSELGLVHSDGVTYLTNNQEGILCSRALQVFDICEGTMIEYWFYGDLEYGDSLLIEIMNDDGIIIWNHYIRESSNKWEFHQFDMKQHAENTRVDVQILFINMIN